MNRDSGFGLEYVITSFTVYGNGCMGPLFVGTLAPSTSGRGYTSKLYCHVNDFCILMGTIVLVRITPTAWPYLTLTCF